MHLKNLLQTRKNFLALLEGLSLDEINYIPATHNNNIFWNFAHTLVTQQLLCYKLSGLPMLIEESRVEMFRKGTKPEGFYPISEVEYFKTFAMTAVENFEEDLITGKFKHFTEYPTTYGVVLNSIEEAVAFNNLHEALHFGYAMALRKIVQKQD